MPDNPTSFGGPRWISPKIHLGPPKEESLFHDQTVQWESTLICSCYNFRQFRGCGPRYQTLRA